VPIGRRVPVGGGVGLKVGDGREVALPVRVAVGCGVSVLTGLPGTALEHSSPKTSSLPAPSAGVG
jgi:hypothetical protein